MAAAQRGAHVRGDRAPGAACSSSASRSTACASPAASRRCAPTCRCSCASSPACGCRPRRRRRSPARSRTCRSPPTVRRSACSPTSCATPGSIGSTSASTRSTAPSSSAMTRRDELVRVLDGIEAAKEAGFAPVKINAVVERGVNDDEIVDLARFGRDDDVEVRFIEFMPLDATGHWMNRAGRRPGRDRRRHRRRVPARADARSRRSAGRASGATCDGGGTVGVIPTRHQAVLRRLRPCAPHRRRPVPHVPVRHQRVRPAGSRCAPAPPTTSWPAEIQRAVGTKWAGHQINQVTFVRPKRTMSQIGG